MMSLPAVDPALQLTLRAGLSLLFAWAASHKISDRAAFRSALASHALLPGNWTVPAANALIATEVAVAVAQWIPGLASAGAAGAAGLLSLYAGAIAVNLARGRRDIDCGCAGAARRQPISGWLVARNVIIAVAALVAALPAAPRPLAWLDMVTVVAAVVAAALLYGAADTLLANSPRSAALGAAARAGA